MSVKRALIVDDSRSARAFLTRILERYDLQVDSAESAEDAIEYLNRSRPDVIFLDHLMPGMDGFQALSLIKTNPRTATIPVMMYTSQEGELYLSQARALGAMGVLPKQTQPADVSRALEQLRLLGERLPESDIATVRVPLGGASGHASGHAGGQAGGLSGLGSSLGDSSASSGSIKIPALPVTGFTPEMRAELDSLLSGHSAELRRFVSQSLQQHTERIVGEVRSLIEGVDGDGAGAGGSNGTHSDANIVPAAKSYRAVPWLGAAAAIIAALAGILSYRTYTEDQQVSSALPKPAGQTVLPPMGTKMRASAPRVNTETPPHASALLVETVPFGESPFSGARIDPIRAVLERLRSSGVRSKVEIRSYSGRFCTQGVGDAVSLPAADVNYAKCDSVASAAEAADPAARQSVAFANMLSDLRSRSGGAVEVVLMSGSAGETVAPYPAIADALTAGEWNRAAAANNRVEVHTRASP